MIFVRISFSSKFLSIKKRAKLISYVYYIIRKDLRQPEIFTFCPLLLFLSCFYPGFLPYFLSLLFPGFLFYFLSCFFPGFLSYFLSCFFPGFLSYFLSRSYPGFLPYFLSCFFLFFILFFLILSRIPSCFLPAFSSGEKIRKILYFLYIIPILWPIHML